MADCYMTVTDQGQVVHRVYNMDAFEFLESLASESVDLIVTDPPYESLEKHRKQGTTTRLSMSKGSSNAWFKTVPNSRLEELMAGLYRVLRRDSHCYVMCDPETMFLLKPAGESAGFKFWKPLVWGKMATGLGYHYRASYEVIMFFEKGKRKLADLGMRDVLLVKRLKGKSYYPTQKPVELLAKLVAQSGVAGGTLLDPFCGSGAVGVAGATTDLADGEGMRFLGNDISPQAMQAAIMWLSSTEED